ncbi:SigE family RNA polymerase sigma factor [Streptomyces hainanensis]|uniref:SigE family RNA polymerase sigma factor n=1 Tax=Streptomyces hainanensis TaxID=402648 RepID=A0A4R4SE52_9ACTN|nr:SigE family RNA polymerase sigma factor [Streptomyces hainanensis]TDC61588.1 SigE family RNA polymerase sigma factor [Streptomyces hainanensis]
MASPNDEFHAFFEQHHAELSRLAYLLLGGSDSAESPDDLAADALVAIWHHWDRVRAARHPLAYARGVVANLARSRIRSRTRERRRIALFWSQHGESAEGPDIPAMLDVRAALHRLPYRKRACVVLRHAFDLSERETARTLGISVGTVKSQTSRGMAELERMLTEVVAPTGEGDPQGLLRGLRSGPVERRGLVSTPERTHARASRRPPAAAGGGRGTPA